MYAEFDARVMMHENESRSPCIFVLIVESEAEIEAFNLFRHSEFVKLFREDIKNYTNCVPEWTVAEIVGY